MSVIFVRKPVDLDEVRYWTRAGLDPEQVSIAETINLSTAAYDEFVRYFCQSRDWLRGKGGTAGCLLVKAPKRQSLVIDPQGYDYARYVALA